jgi:hypothetical protein
MIQENGFFAKNVRPSLILATIFYCTLFFLGIANTTISNATAALLLLWKGIYLYRQRELKSEVLVFALFLLFLVPNIATTLRIQTSKHVKEQEEVAPVRREAGRKSSDGREVIGKWRDDSVPQIASTVVLYKENGKYYLDYRFDKDGSKATDELRKEEGKKGIQQFRRLGHPGDYYVITQDNSLESRDSHGIIFTARPIKILAKHTESKTSMDSSKVSLSGKGEGFRGISWGTDISALKDMKLFYAFDGTSQLISYKEYERTGDENEIGDAKVNIMYSFWNNKLYEVTILWASGSWESLVQTIFEKYGNHKLKVTKQFRGITKEAAWIHGRTKIDIYYSLSYDRFERITEETASVTLSSVDMKKAQDAYMRQAKKQAKDRADTVERQEKLKLEKRAKEAAKTDL